jgi:hypothetical protein
MRLTQSSFYCSTPKHGDIPSSNDAPEAHEHSILRNAEVA